MEETNKEFNVGDIVEGKIVSISEKQVFVDIGFKTEGIIPISELSHLHIDTPNEVVEEGQELTLKVTKVEEDEIILSKKAVDADKSWEILTGKYENGEIFETEVKEVVKGGLVVDVGLRGFIPASLVETHFVEDFSDYLNKNLEVKIVDLDQEQNRLILSHRAVLELEANKDKQALLESLKKGQVIDGKVQRITNFGAFVDIGGVDGLVHISELAHAHVDKVTDIVSEGDTIKVEVLSVDPESERISLSHKNTLAGPWENISERIQEGDVVKAVVKRLVDFGAFLEIEDGVEGLVHISEIADRHIETPNEELTVGQELEVKVLSVNEADQRISLSIKAIAADAEQKDILNYQKEEEGSGFQLGDLIGDKLDKYK